MVGITSYGAYVPFWRLSRAAIAAGLPGEKAIANFDEDSITMAVAAGMDALTGVDRKGIDGISFASTSSPYVEKQASSLIGAALDLRRDVSATDYGSSLRGATQAIRAAVDAVKAGSAKNVLVTASDCRVGSPGSDMEKSTGDGAGAVIIGDSNVAVSIEAIHSVADEIQGVWRPDGVRYVQTWHDRFVTEYGYFKAVKDAVTGLLKKTNLAPKDFTKAVFYTPDARRITEISRMLGFDPKTQVQNPFADVMGCTGTALPLQLLVAALEDAKPGDLILLASYGDGSDAMVLKVQPQIESIRKRKGMKKLLASKKAIGDYKVYLQWKDIIQIEGARRPDTIPPSASAAWREQNEILRLYAGKCRSCGKVQYPAQRVCVNCRALDSFENVRLSDKKGTLFSYAMDYISSSKDVPLVVSVVNMEGGGRILNMMTDRVQEDLKIGMPVEMTFRKLYYVGGIHHYFWKSVPVRA